MKLFRFIGSLADRICIVAGAFIGSQIPQFIQQYTQRLAAHIAELDHLLTKLRRIASLSDKTLDQYIQKFLSSSDPDFSRQGEFIDEMLRRFHVLSDSLQKITESRIWTRPFIFLKEIHRDLFETTLDSFQPGLVLSVEGICYTFLGALLGFLFYQGFSKSILIVYKALFKKGKDSDPKPPV